MWFKKDSSDLRFNEPYSLPRVNTHRIKKKNGGGVQNNSANRHLWKNNKTVANKMKVSDEELKNGAEFLVAGPEVAGQSL